MHGRLVEHGDAGASRPTGGGLPTVEALDALWREVTAKPLYAPPNLRRYLALRWRARLDLLDAGPAPRPGPLGGLGPQAPDRGAVSPVQAVFSDDCSLIGVRR